MAAVIVDLVPLGSTLASSPIGKQRNKETIKQKTKSVFYSESEIYRPTVAACLRSQCKLLRVEAVAWSAQRIPVAVNLSFLDWSHFFFIQAAPQLHSRG
jgi:hypothetical protein